MLTIGAFEGLRHPFVQRIAAALLRGRCNAAAAVLASG
jgi:hypothetical protein